MSIDNEKSDNYWKLNVEDNKEIFFKNPSRVEYDSWYSGDDGYRVGIGITNPQHALDVSGNINFTGELLDSGIRVDDWQISGDNIYNINITGNVGIGTTNPTGGLLQLGQGTLISKPLLHLNTERGWYLGQGDTSGASTALYLYPDTDNKDFIIGSQDLSKNYIRVRSHNVSGNGFLGLCEDGSNVGIGTNNPQSQLHIEGPDDATPPMLFLSNTSEDWGGIRFGDSSASTTQNFDFLFNASSQDFKIRSDDTDNIMYIDLNGNVGLGVVNPTYQLELSTDSAAKPTSSTWTISSDRRVKEEIKNADLDICYNDIKTLPLRHFKWCKKYRKHYKVKDKHNLGFIAQEVEEVNKSAVNTNNNKVFGIEDFKTINKDQLIMSLFGAVKKLQEKVEELENKEEEQVNLTEIVERLNRIEENSNTYDFKDTINVHTQEEVFSFSKILTNRKTYSKAGKIPVYIESLNSTKYITIWD